MPCFLSPRLQRLSIDIVAPVNFSSLLSRVFQRDPLPNASLLVEHLACAFGGRGYAGVNLKPGVYFYSTNPPGAYLRQAFIRRRRLFEHIRYLCIYKYSVDIYCV